MNKIRIFLRVRYLYEFIFSLIDRVSNEIIRLDIRNLTLLEHSTFSYKKFFLRDSANCGGNCNGL